MSDIFKNEAMKKFAIRLRPYFWMDANENAIIELMVQVCKSGDLQRFSKIGENQDIVSYEPYREVENLKAENEWLKIDADKCRREMTASKALLQMAEKENEKLKAKLDEATLLLDDTLTGNPDNYWSIKDFLEDIRGKE